MTERKVTIILLNDIRCQITGLGSYDLECLYDEYGLFVKNHFFMPDVKLGTWDGKKRLVTRDGMTYIYLLKTIVPKIIERGYKIKLDDRRRTFHLPDNLEVRQDIFSQYLDEYGEPTMLRDYQMYGINAILKNHGGILLAGTGAGKAQPLSSKILTSKGWVRMGEIAIGDEVITPTNELAPVTSIHPQPPKSVYEVTFHDGTSVRCCGEHLWKVKRPTKLWRTDTEWDIVDTDYIRDFLQTKSRGDWLVPGDISIPLCDAIEYRHVTDCQLPIDPYLFGVLIGNGTLRDETPILSDVDTFLIDECARIIRETTDLSDLSLTHIENTADYRISGRRGIRTENPLLTKLIALGLGDSISNTKFIPTCYKETSIENRMSLLQGLMDTNGTCGERNVSFTTVSETLAHDVQEIVQSLGGICTITSRTPTFTYDGERKEGHLTYTCFIAFKDHSQLFRAPTKKKKCRTMFADGRVELMRRVVDVREVEYEPTQCITVDHPDHLYITDNYTVTHNTIISASFTKIYGDLGLRVVTIVPTASLVLQSSLAFKSWGLDCGRLDKDSKELDKTHLVTTWQSLQNIGVALKNYDVVIVDECQAAQANVLSDLIQTYGCDSLVRIGLTGTMPEYKLDNLMVRVMLGDIRYEVPAHVLIDKQYLSTIDIEVHQLQETCAEDYFPDYASEMNYLQGNEQRNLWVRNFVVELSQQPNGNVLMLVASKRFGKKFAKMFPNAYFVCGDDHVKDRAKIYDLFKKENNLIVITTVQVAGTGLSIDRVFNLVLMDLGKSFTRIIQAVGRGLRRNAKAGKIHCNIHDLSSNLKYSKRHQTKRIKHYKDHQYPYKVTKVHYRSFDLDEIVD